MSTILSSVCTHRAVSHVVRTHPNLITNRRDALRAYPRLGPLKQVLVTAPGARDAVSETVEIGTSAVSPDTSIRQIQPFFIVYSDNRNRYFPFSVELPARKSRFLIRPNAPNARLGLGRKLELPKVSQPSFQPDDTPFASAWSIIALAGQRAPGWCTTGLPVVKEGSKSERVAPPPPATGQLIVRV